MCAREYLRFSGFQIHHLTTVTLTLSKEKKIFGCFPFEYPLIVRSYFFERRSESKRRRGVIVVAAGRREVNKLTFYVEIAGQQPTLKIFRQCCKKENVGWNENMKTQNSTHLVYLVYTLSSSTVAAAAAQPCQSKMKRRKRSLH